VYGFIQVQNDERREKPNLYAAFSREMKHTHRARGLGGDKTTAVRTKGG
jgi:hypothetical protein